MRVPASGPAVRHGRAFPFLLALLTLSVWLWLPGTVLAQGPPAALVATERIVEAPLTEEIALVGTTRALLDSLVASEIGGRVLQRAIENGERVKKGQVLVRLDSLRLRRDLERAEAELDEVEARLARATRVEERAVDLHDSNVLSTTLLDQAVSDRLALAGQQAQVTARIASIRDDIDRSAIKAPFAGVVTEIHTEVGEWVRQGDPVARVAAFDTIEIVLEAPERYFPAIRAGDIAPADLDSLPGVKLDGKIFAVVPRADSAARTFPVIVRAPNPGGQVGAGMLARVNLVLSSRSAVLQVPKDAIVRQSTGDVVFVVEGDSVRLVPVRTGRANGSRIEVIGELAAGGSVVVRGNERLMPGQKIREGDVARDGSATAGGNR